MKIKIVVNEKEVNLSEFPARIITNTILAMLKSLSGMEEIKIAVVTLTEVE
jgi:hypothetical protein